MNKLILALALAGTSLVPIDAYALIARGKVGTPGLPINTALPEIVGLDTVGSTMFARMGNWTNSPSTFTCSWHYVGGSSLGTNCASFGPLTSDRIGQRLQVDVTAINGVGNGLAISDFVGPVRTSLPTLPAPGAGTAPSALPTYPANYIENGWPVYPGCSIPDPAPANTGSPTHEWYFDPVAGHTLQSGATGHAGSPFNDATAIGGGALGYGSLAGFTSVGTVTGTQAFLNGTNFGASPSGGAVFVNGIKQGIQSWNNTNIEINLVPPGVVPTTGNTEVDVGLYGRSIQPGDIAYLKANPSGATVGSITLGNQYSTSNGASTGSTIFTWIKKDPASVANPMLSGVLMNSDQGFLFDGVGVEQISIPASNGGSMVQVTGTIANPSKDIIFANMNLCSWPGHCNDPFDPSTYPSSGGHGDGTVQTASPYVSGVDPEDPPSLLATSAANATQIFFTTFMPQVGNYVWSPGYYYQQQFPNFPVLPPNNTGIPNGTIVKNLNGNANAVFINVIATSASLPGTAILNQAYLAADTHHLWIGNATPAWVDSGLAFATIGACDKVLDAATGCPTTNYPGLSTNLCQGDPLVNGSGGCGGSPTPWSGTTRALNLPNDYLTFTNRMRVVLAGWWTHLDWDYAQVGFAFSGSMGGGSIDPSNPNDVEGTQCVSTKNDTVRWTNTHISNSLLVNSVHYGDRMKYRAQDAIQVFSSHRLIISHNFSADSSFDRGHPDFIQYASSSAGTAAFFYGNAAVDNEFYTHVDLNDQFPFFSQGVGVTDQVYSGSYMANNILFASQNPSGIAGLWNVNVHNDVFMDFNSKPGDIAIKSGNKGNVNLPAFSMMSNNLTNSIFRNNGVPGTNTNCSADNNTVGGNLALPTLDMVAGTTFTGNNTYCTNSNAIVNGNLAGAFPDLKVWAPVSYLTGSTNPLFTDYSPVPPAALPAPGGFVDIPSWCLRNEFRIGICNVGDVGRLNLRPSAMFIPTSTTILGSVTNITQLPTTGVTIGDAYVAGSAVVSCTGFPTCPAPGVPFPAGLYTKTGAATNAWTGSVYSPAVISAGNNIGAQLPPTNHARLFWTNPTSPNIGAY